MSSAPQTHSITIELTDEQIKKLRQLGQQFSKTENGPVAIETVVMEVIERLIDDEIDDDIGPLESFREAWGQAMRNEGLRPARDVLRELRAAREAEDEQ